MKKLIEALKEKLGDSMSDELIEELKANYDVLVNEKVQELSAVKEGELTEAAEKEMTEFKETLIESIGTYIEYATTEYLEENKVAIEAGSKVSAAEKIIESAKAVFKEIGLEIPETELNLVKTLEASLEESNSKLNDATTEVIESRKQSFEYEKAINFQKATETLTESKTEEVHTLLEGLEYKDLDDFDRKVKIVIEKIVNKKEFIKENVDEKDLDDLNDTGEKKNSIDKYLVK